MHLDYKPSISSELACLGMSFDVAEFDGDQVPFFELSICKCKIFSLTVIVNYTIILCN